MTFADAAARDAYVAHPEDTNAFKTAALPVVDAVIVFDFETV